MPFVDKRCECHQEENECYLPAFRVEISLTVAPVFLACYCPRPFKIYMPTSTYRQQRADTHTGTCIITTHELRMLVVSAVKPPPVRSRAHLDLGVFN
jgi:hypothetical protein